MIKLNMKQIILKKEIHILCVLKIFNKISYYFQLYTFWSYKKKQQLN